MTAAITFFIALAYLIIAVSVGYLVAQTASSDAGGNSTHKDAQKAKALAIYFATGWPLMLPLAALVLLLIKNGLIFDDFDDDEGENTATS